MGIIAQKQRIKEATRIGILEAALKIVKAEGWDRLSMRKIAEQIEYSPTVIYEYFDNKEALLNDLAGIGFSRLTKTMKNAAAKVSNPQQKLENMWEAYWKFAFAEKEFYQLLFGVGIMSGNSPVAEQSIYAIAEFVLPVVRKTLPGHKQGEFFAQCRFYLYWSAYHGLICLNFLNWGYSDKFIKQVLIDIMQGNKTADDI